MAQPVKQRPATNREALSNHKLDENADANVKNNVMAVEEKNTTRLQKPI